MKKLAILSAIALSGLIYNTANAQIRIRVGLNFEPRPVIYTRVPVLVQQRVYDQPEQVYDDSNDDDYYYLPDVDAYYNVNAQSYYYYNGDNWITCAYLPGTYRNYSWRSGRRFAIREHRPFIRNDYYRSRYNGREVAEWRHFNNNNHYGGYGGGYTRNNHFDRDAYRRNDNHFDNRGGNYNRGNHYGNSGQGSFDQSGQNNGGRYDGRGRSARPSTQNWDNRGGNEHFAGNSRPIGMSHRQARY
ncbi:hypothetical protein [Mucilaginibacter sp.]|uniref:hypothetical protein n=1 Tax=Mucilaginibacter sp. TaxID=1882438 RepID=UPI0026179002|nr:hypothetical protein [Mucilaginibacter sp.]MDB4918928.1 hypothetical protein [Mucilaginibacter sp.]